MTKEVVVLENEVTLMGKTFNVYGTVEEPLFMAKDVAEWIEHSDAQKMVQTVDEDERCLMTNPNNVRSGGQSAWFLTENGVYEVLMLSRKPVAKEFKKEVKKMLHALRTKKAALMPTNFADALEAYAKEVRAREEAQQALFAETQQKLLALEQKEQVKKDALVIAGWAEQRTVLAYSIIHNKNWNVAKRKEVGKQLATIARLFNHNVGKVFDRDFGTVNAYGPDTWKLWEEKFLKNS